MNVLKQSHDHTDSGRLFQTTGAHTLKARHAIAVLVDGKLKSVRDADRNDILVPVVRAGIRSRQHVSAAVVRPIHEVEGEPKFSIPYRI